MRLRLRALLAVALLCAAGPAHAVSAILHFDGYVSSYPYPIDAPSVTALGLTYGSPLHYEVKVDTDALGHARDPIGGFNWIEDQWNAPDDFADAFYAELVEQAYPTPGSFYDRGLQLFVGWDYATPGDDGCPLDGELRVGLALFRITGCGSVAEWQVGKSVSSQHFWQDPDTDAFVTAHGQLTLTDIVPVPEPGATAMLASGATLLACLHRRRTRA